VTDERQSTINVPDRVWLLWDDEDLVSAHATEAAARRACQEYTSRVRAEMGEPDGTRDLHINISPITVQGAPEHRPGRRGVGPRRTPTKAVSVTPAGSTLVAATAERTIKSSRPVARHQGS
jgi:hypothetical protein